jgi:putative peptide zinc metalloprotease protein
MAPRIEFDSSTSARGASRLSAASRLSFPTLSIVPEDDEFIVGAPDQDVFVSIPEIGVVALEVLRVGGTIGEAEQIASDRAGEPVKVLEFAEALIEAGLVSAIEGVPLEGPAPSRSWVWALRPEIAQPLFSRPAWVMYAALFAGCVAVLVARPALFPTFEDTFFYPDPAVCLVTVLLANLALVACHEVAHWAAGRAEGVGARFRVSRRLFIPVFETDLSQLWSVPRSRRFGPCFAGIAFDTVVLSVALGLRLAWTEGLGFPPLFVRFLGAVVLLKVLGIGFQLQVFLRTDLYAALTIALGCRDLYRVNQLRLRKLFGLLRPEQAEELADAHPRDLRVSRWFLLLYLVGLVWMGWVFVRFFLPGTVLLAGWMVRSLVSTPPGTPGFWEALAIAAVAAFQAGLPLAVFVWERVQRWRGAAAT